MKMSFYFTPPALGLTVFAASIVYIPVLIPRLVAYVFQSQRPNYTSLDDAFGWIFSFPLWPALVLADIFVSLSLAVSAYLFSFMWLTASCKPPSSPT
jgi:hypothetical protein